MAKADIYSSINMQDFTLADTNVNGLFPNQTDSHSPSHNRILSEFIFGSPILTTSEQTEFSIPDSAPVSATIWSAKEAGRRSWVWHHGDVVVENGMTYWK